MDRTGLYKLLDIESADEFKFYENLSALLEADEYIEEELIAELVRDIDRYWLAEHMDSFCEQFLANIPDSETELYMIVESLKRMMEGLISEDMTSDEIAVLAGEISKFRKWYVHDLNVFDRLTGEELCVRDARYNIMAAKFLGQPYDYDFRTALDYDIDGYDVRLSDIVDI